MYRRPLHDDSDSGSWDDGDGDERVQDTSDIAELTPSGEAVVTVRCDLDKEPVLANFAARSWAVTMNPLSVDVDGRVLITPADRSAASQNWVLWWASVHTVKALSLSTAAELRLLPHQRLNHFFNHWELTRKDRMFAHIAKYSRAANSKGRRRQMVDDNVSRANGALLTPRVPTSELAGVATVRDFVPSTFVLPHDFAMLVDASRSEAGAMWIVKPANKSQGRGIFIVRDVHQIPAHLRNRSAARIDPFVVSRYVERPLLVEGRKFDLRIYVLVTNYSPLRAFRHESAFARFCSVPYPVQSTQRGSISADGLVAHLTNTSFQKTAGVGGGGVGAAPGAAPQHVRSKTAVMDYGDVVQQQWSTHGGKWSWENVLQFVALRYGDAAMRRMATQLDFVIVESLRAVQHVIHNDAHCFELYGYDMLIDEALKPWLLEVNASPSLTPSTEQDLALKRTVVGDVLNIVTDADDPTTPLSVLRSRPLELLHTGGFTCIVDE